MTSNTKPEAIMQSDKSKTQSTFERFTSFLDRLFTLESKQPDVEAETIIKKTSEQWKHQRSKNATTEEIVNSPDIVSAAKASTERWTARNNKAIESTEQGTQPSSLADAEPTHKSRINVMDEQQELITDLGEAIKTIQEAGINKSSEENDEMAVAKSTVEMTSDEVIDYAQERVKESPLKKTLAGIKFPKRKVTKVEQVEKDKEV